MAWAEVVDSDKTLDNNHDKVGLEGTLPTAAASATALLLGM